ncbi:MAG TPA: cation diffusion facilitator family transporter [bacterium]|nr:cation diffusion facilitator family transporter [bacterium]HPR89339.1 cation diffusion facilitator family transporter [bacterium]
MDHTTPVKSPSLTRYAWLSIGAAVLTIGLKGTAYLLTGSVGLLSDALESMVNLAAAIMALAMLTVASRPPDELHAFGHSKAEYFSSGVEGALILLAAGMIGITAIPRLLAPQPLEKVGVGLVISSAASLINLATGRILLQAGRRHQSITLEADAHHLMTDVWTSVGVLVGIGAVTLTGWERLDPIIALIVAANIVWTGFQLLRRSALGLMDTALADSELTLVHQLLESYTSREVHYHALWTRQAGARKFISVHILVPGDWPVQQGHDLIGEIEDKIHTLLPGAHFFTHLEPINDPAANQDLNLDRR